MLTIYSVHLQWWTGQQQSALTAWAKKTGNCWPLIVFDDGAVSSEPQLRYELSSSSFQFGRLVPGPRRRVCRQHRRQRPLVTQDESAWSQAVHAQWFELPDAVQRAGHDPRHSVAGRRRRQLSHRRRQLGDLGQRSSSSSRCNISVTTSTASRRHQGPLQDTARHRRHAQRLVGPLCLISLWKVKRSSIVFMVIHYRATKRHLPYGITSDTNERAPFQPQPSRPILDLPTPEGWKADT